MKWIIGIVALLIVFAIGLGAGYKIGFRARPPISDKQTLLVQLSLDAGNYNSLKTGNVGLVEDNLRVRIWGEVKACDLYTREDPSFNTQNESLKLWSEKGRVIAHEEEELMKSLPAEPK